MGAAFDVSLLPARALPWVQPVTTAAAERDLSPYLLFAVMDRESLCGEALKPKGPSGTGDFTPRALSKRYQPGGLFRAAVLERKVMDPDGSTRLERVPAVVPADGLGWGRGLFQADLAAHPEFCSSERWKNPLEAARQAAMELRDDLALWLGDLACALASYNAGPANVRHALASLRSGATPEQRLSVIDTVTTEHNYASDVLRRLAQFTPHAP